MLYRCSSHLWSYKRTNELLYIGGEKVDKLLTNFIVSIISRVDNVINTVFNNLIDVCFNAGKI